MLHQKSSEVTLIVYDTPSPPRCYRVNKKIIKLILGLSSILLLALFLTSLLLTSYIKVLKNKNDDLNNELKAIPLLKSENMALKLENRKLLESGMVVASTETPVEETVEPIGPVATSTPPEVTKPQVPKKFFPKPEEILNYFKIPTGFNNLSKQNYAEIQRINFRVKRDKNVFRFNLANGNKVRKLSGHIFVIQYTQDDLEMYPSYDLKTLQSKINFQDGESFTVSRFRPTIATFEKPQNANEVFYKIIVFSRDGDLLVEEYHGPYNL